MPPHEPLEDVSVWPSRAVPLITGGDALTGAVALRVAPAADVSASTISPAAAGHTRRFARIPTGWNLAVARVSVLHPESGIAPVSGKGGAEGEGFEPSSDPKARNGFRDRRIRPLCHPSATLHRTVRCSEERRGALTEKEGFEPSMETFIPITP